MSVSVSCTYPYLCHIVLAGVRLRNNPDAGPPPAPEDDLGLPFIESQLCAATADPHDRLLSTWTKRKVSSSGVLLNKRP